MTALKASEVTRYVARPDLSEGVFLAYGPDGAAFYIQFGSAWARP